LWNGLNQNSVADAELLINLSKEELEALALTQLASHEQTRLNALLDKNAESQLSLDEDVELDKLLEQIDHLNILKTRARYTLR